MGSQFKRLIKNPEKKGAAAQAAPTPTIYTDKSVCRCLRIRRGVLGAARTAEGRGRDWDAVGDEVGMTHDWVVNYALDHGIVPDFFNGQLETVSGRYVSVRLVGTHPNNCICIVELEASGKREFARIRNIMQYPIGYREVFSCVRINLPADKHLEWIAGPNEV